MTIRTTLTTAALALCLSLTGCASTGDETPAESGPSTATASTAETAEMDPEAMMAAYAEANATNENHARMAEMAGTWDVAGKSWMGPDQPPMESTGTAEFTVILNGRYVRQDYSADFMGMPYQGVGIAAYDNARKVHIDHWFDNMGTSPYVAEGNWDDAGTTYTAIAEHLDVLSGRTERMKNVMQKVSDDEFVFTMYVAQPDGSWMRSMELTYTRKK